jgi:crossover junction endodeoxyribonuclease RuvC
MGYSIIKFNGRKGDKLNLDLVETDVIITPPEVEMHKRLEMLYKELNSISQKHSPDIMVIEKLFFNTNAKTAINVGQARGVSMLVAAKKKMQVYEYTALEAKMAVTGYGRSDKKQMQEGVKNLLKLDMIIKSDDANDAVAITLCHIKKANV